MMPKLPINNTEIILQWYNLNKRDLPWRKTKEPYMIWLSEIILQQTRIEQGIPYYLAFIQKYPDVFCLANATEEEVLKLWQGLGYYSRARNMHETAKRIVFEHDGRFPEDFKPILTLKGVGDYTASLIASVCFGQAHAVLDGNVLRVLSRFYGSFEPIDSNSGKKHFKMKANELLDQNNPGDFNQAMMDLGSTICTSSKPFCTRCCLKVDCVAFKNNLQNKLPVKSKKAELKTRYLNYFLISDNKGLILNKRSENDIWKNLFELPLVEKDKPEKLKLEDVEFANIREATGLHEICQTNHLLTHRKLEIVFYRLEFKSDINCLFPNGLFYVKNEELMNFAVPKPIEKFIKSLNIV